MASRFGPVSSRCFSYLAKHVGEDLSLLMFGLRLIDVDGLTIGSPRRRYVI